MKIVKFLVFFLMAFNLCFGHEVPAMSRYELAHAKETRQRLVEAKVKTLTLWKYVVDKGIVTDKRERTLEQDYDARGNLIRLVAFNNNILSQEVRFTFNDKNQMLTDTDYDSSGHMKEQITYTFLPGGLVKGGIKTDSAGKQTETFSYTYSFNQVIVEEKAIEGIIKEKTFYTYNITSGKRDYSEAKQYNEKNELAISVKQFFNNENMISEKQVDFADSSKSFSWLYPEFNKLNRYTKAIKKMKSGAVVFIDLHTYNEYGIRTEIKEYKADMLKSVTRIEFEFF